MHEITLRRFIVVISLISLAGCAHHYSSTAIDDPYGFFSGVWHGIVFPFALLANVVSWALSIFGVEAMQSIEIIGRPNTGVFYYVGFVFGLGSIGSSSKK
jgi:hypothetical protein